MRIKVTDDNQERLKAALDSANGNAWRHAAAPRHVQNLAVRAEETLKASGLPAWARVGAEVVWHGAGASALAYRYKMARTQITLTRGAKHWFLTDAKRVGVSPKRSEHYRISISSAQRDRIIATALRTFEVRCTAADVNEALGAV